MTALLKQSKRWRFLPLLLVFGLAIIFAIQTKWQFEETPPLPKCYEFEERQILLVEGIVRVNGVHAGHFSIERGDATKGPDRIIWSGVGDSGVLSTIDRNRVWLIDGPGLKLPLKSGEYRLAPACK